MRKLKKTLTLLLTLVLLAACAPAGLAEDTPTLRIGLEQDIETIDPQQNTSAYTLVVTEGIAEPLLREHEGEILPGLAESYTTDDYQTWLFNIRADACWSDGTPITAEDIVWSYQEIFTRAESAKVVVLFKAVQGYDDVKAVADSGADADTIRAAAQESLAITALDEHTIQVVLSAPSPWALDTFCSTAWAPIKRDLYEQYGSAYGSSADKIGMNGPYVVSEWRFNEQLTLEKNPNYWNADNIVLDKVELVIVQAVEPRVNMFKEGKLDYAVASSDYLLTMPDDTEVLEGTSWYFMLVNDYRRDVDGNLVDEKLSALLANDHFSAAINNAINRTVLYESVLANPAYVATGYAIPGAVNSNNTAHETIAELRDGAYSDIAPLTRDMEKAESELALALAEVGYASVADVPEIKVVCANTTDYETVAEYLENALDAALGLKVKMDAVEFKVRDSRVISGDYDLLLFGWNNSTNDVIDYLEPFESELFATGWNFAKPELYAQYSAMVQEITSTTDLDRRAALALEAEQLLLEHGPIITMSVGGRAHLKSDRFEGFHVRVMGGEFDYVFAAPAK